MEKPGRTNFITMGHVSRAEALVFKLYLESTGLLDLVEPEDAVRTC